MGHRKILLLFLAVATLLAGCQSSSTKHGFSASDALADGGYVLHKAPEGLSAPISPLSRPDATVAVHPVPPVGHGQLSAAGLADTCCQRRRRWLGGRRLGRRRRVACSFRLDCARAFVCLERDRKLSGPGHGSIAAAAAVGAPTPSWWSASIGRTAVWPCLSIPRDLYIEIPGYGWSRINTADYIGEKILPVEGGGPALISQILSNTFGISTDHWVRMEMNGFKSVVDAVGGVTIHLDCPFYEPIFNLTTDSWDYFTLPAGDVWMDGETAYWFVRLRLRESDIGRAKRQRQFLWALRDQASNTNLLLRAPELWSAFQETFSTDLSLLEMVDYAQLALSVDAGNVRAAGISLADLQSYTTSQGASVLRIADQARVQRVVDGIWDAPAMADAYRQDAANCQPIPVGAAVDNVPTEVQAVAEPEAVDEQAEGAPAEGEQPAEGAQVEGEQPANN